MTKDVAVIAHRLETVKYMQVVSTTMLVTDWFILFDDEVNFIWTSRWTLTKFLYMLSRYLPFLDCTLDLIFYLSPHIAPHTCKWNYTVATWSTAVGMGLTELILVMRTWAIYDRSRRILYSLGALWVVWVAANIPIIHLFTRSLKYGDPPHPKISGCYAVEGSVIVFASFASLLCFEILIVVLTVKRAVFHYRHRTVFNRNVLLTVLYRDGIVFFILLAACSLGNVILLVTAPDEYLDLLDTFTRIVHSLLCCRVLLNLKKANHGRSTVHNSSASQGDGAGAGALHHPWLGPTLAAPPPAGLVFAKPHTVDEAETVVYDIALEPREAGRSTTPTLSPK